MMSNIIETAEEELKRNLPLWIIFMHMDGVQGEA